MTVLAPTKPGTQKLSEVARKVVAPRAITSTGWPSIKDICEKKLGIEFDPWQDGAGRLILAKRADGKLAAMIDGVGLSIPRQVGKTYLIGAMTFALCIHRPGMLVLWSAHHARTHGETFLAMQGFADRQRVKPYVRQVILGSGDEEIRFVNGSRILFGARQRGFGRGIPGVDMIMSDEAQIMSDKALDAQLATMNTSPFGLGLFVGTPPRPDDPSEAFTRMRDDAWAGRLHDGTWIEFGADPGSDPDDRKQWAKANPSFPSRTPPESMLRLRRKLKPDSFLREGLGVWDEPTNEELAWRLTLEEWQLTERQVPKPGGAPAFFITAADHLRSVSIAVAALGEDRPHVELADHRAGSSWLTSRVKELSAAYPGAVFATYHAGPIKAWIPDFAREGVELQLLTQPQAASAWAHVKLLVESKGFTHAPDARVDESILGTEWRALDGGAWIVDWKNSTGNPAPVSAEAGALWVLESRSALPMIF